MRKLIYIAIARNLREFGYSGVSANMVAEVHAAMRSGDPLPHGVVGMFAKSQIEESGLGSGVVS
jgi:hypothetical protein